MEGLTKTKRVDAIKSRLLEGGRFTLEKITEEYGVARRTAKRDLLDLADMGVALEYEKLPDGSRYSIIRYQGLFSTKFHLEPFPFDTQVLTVVMEDTLAGVEDQVYVPDGKTPAIIDPVITLPGFKVGNPTMRIGANYYPTNFGDPTSPEAEAYSRITISIPVTRPMRA